MAEPSPQRKRINQIVKKNGDLSEMILPATCKIANELILIFTLF